MECIRLTVRPLHCQIFSLVRSMKVPAHHVFPNGTLMREQNGAITATGRENDPYSKYTLMVHLTLGSRSCLDVAQRGNLCAQRLFPLATSHPSTVAGAKETASEAQAIFKMYKYNVEKKLAYKIQSVEDETFLAIDKESENVITKKDPEPEDKSTLFWVKRIHDQDFRVFQSVVGVRSYLYVQENGNIIPSKISEEDLEKDISTWFRVEEVDGHIHTS